jgi:hypothetical protein
MTDVDITDHLVTRYDKQPTIKRPDTGQEEGHNMSRTTDWPADTELCPITYGTMRKITSHTPGMADRPHAAQWPYRVTLEELPEVAYHMASELANIAKAMLEDPHIHPDDAHWIRNGAEWMSSFEIVEA